MEQTTGPNHYRRGTIQPWDFIRDQGLNYHLGNAIKYISRAGHKLHASKQEDLEKAIHYLQNELEYTIYESELTGPSGGVPHRLQSFDEWSSESDTEMFD